MLMLPYWKSRIVSPSTLLMLKGSDRESLEDDIKTEGKIILRAMFSGFFSYSLTLLSK